tara:strand:+ start:32 stop:436 length:405 start_codon:yes stop_codon:yes gene_type:complete
MILEELMTANPKISVIVLSFVVTFIMTLVTKKFTNQSRMKELKDIQKACQIKLKDNRGNPEKMAEINKEMMQCSMELMKHSFKPLLITFIPLIIFFMWIRGIYSGTELGKSWIWYYIVSGIVWSIVLRKVLKVV